MYQWGLPRLVWGMYCSYYPIFLLLLTLCIFSGCVCNPICLPSKLNAGVKLESATGQEQELKADIQNPKKEKHKASP